MRILHSTMDQSVNFVQKIDGPGYLESRYVRRTDDYFIIYLSCQSGCNQACRMCHLTATGQTELIDASIAQILEQARGVFAHYYGKIHAQKVHFNFMARGEPLASESILNHSGVLLHALHAMAAERALDSRVLMSTILPKSLGEKRLEEIFTSLHPEIYYSLYSMSEPFRRRWLGKAHSAEHGLDLLKSWQQATGKIPKIHFAFIEGENDSEADMRAIADAVNARGLKVGINIVRYNPHSDRLGCEPHEDVVLRNTQMLTEWINPESIRIVPKVGFDVKASCGMFVDK